MTTSAEISRAIDAGGATAAYALANASPRFEESALSGLLWGDARHAAWLTHQFAALMVARGAVLRAEDVPRLVLVPGFDADAIARAALERGATAPVLAEARRAGRGDVIAAVRAFSAAIAAGSSLADVGCRA